MSRSKVPIKHTPGVCGGRACIGNRRIAVWMVIESLQMGWTHERLFVDYGLTKDEVDAAITYYQNHAEEIDRDIKENLWTA